MMRALKHVLVHATSPVQSRLDVQWWMTARPFNTSWKLYLQNLKIVERE